jgi:hypothetical protein
MLKMLIQIIEEPKPKKYDWLFKVLDKAQYLMYVGIVVHMLMKLVNTMKKTFGTAKTNNDKYQEDGSIGRLTSRSR